MQFRLTHRRNFEVYAQRTSLFMKFSGYANFGQYYTIWAALHLANPTYVTRTLQMSGHYTKGAIT